MCAGHGGWLVDMDEGHGGHKNGVIKVQLTICFTKMLLKSTSVKRHLEVKKVVVVFSKKLWDDCYSFR